MSGKKERLRQGAASPRRKQGCFGTCGVGCTAQIHELVVVSTDETVISP